ncbi:DUF2252 domain-containing protein [Sphingomonas nostoxanthinifaciens]|nr:DUF2252 domain-containing protein [Sphingomonas nostoxanthinifaciens]UAK26716.1 DUF2252 domain-containing protein [Sphingomonas nostoxanthinifaciens]
MARSTHAYVRGNTVKFYEWLEASPVAQRLPKGPAIWICGDCHLGNLGPLSDGNGNVEIQIRDLDQTVIGNPAHDLIRLGLSLATAARGSDLPGVTTARMIEEMVDGYEHALAERDEGDPGPEPDVVRTVKRQSVGRRWRHLARERIDDAEPTIPLGKKFWALDPEEREALQSLFKDPEIKQSILSLDGKDLDRDLRLVDAAYWMKGCSSLGLLRYAGIIAIRGAKGREDFALIDLKEATAPAAPIADGADMPRDPAERVVTGARALSPYLGERMMAAKLLGKSVFIRELAPQDLKLEVDQFTEGQAVKAARYLSYVVGKAHARQMDAATRTAWRRSLLDHRRSGIEAPSWLWQSVVDLSGSHEAGYLEHCRRYALDRAA